MRRNASNALALILLLLPAAGSADTLLGGDLDPGDVSSPEYATNSLEDAVLFDDVFDDDALSGGGTFLRIDDGGYQLSGFHSRYYAISRGVDPGSSGSALPEPTAAVAFGLGAAIVGAAIRRRRSG